MAKQPVTLLSSLLAALGVPHTQMYSDRRFATMPFRSLFGLTRLLRDYGIDSEGFVLESRQQLASVATPFLAQTTDSFVVVTDVTPSSVGYIDDDGVAHTVGRCDFDRLWTGVILAVYTSRTSAEPDYAAHRITQTGRAVMDRLFYVCAAFLIAAGVVASRSYASVADMSAIVIALAGLYISYLLLLKQMGVKNRAADSVCAVVQAHGCDHVLATSASKFFGLFGWSEVGAAYFGVNLLVMTAAPQYQPWIAMINVFCLPFSFWSVWYQRYRAHSWCTLCLTVQALLWLTFLTQLASGWWRSVVFISWPTFVIGAIYLFALLSINRVMRRLTPASDN